MTNNDAEIIGKNVKDMYGTFMGKVIGTITEIDGSIQSVGIDCGSQGLQQIQYEQLVVQGDTVIFIPKWRLDSQKLLREKQLTLRRLKALMDIVSENDDMKADAEIIHEKYKSKLVSLDEMEYQIKAKLEVRLIELDEQMKSAKMLSFDAKVQFKSNEISDATFETVKSCTTEVIEHVTHEQSEISNVKSRIADLELEVQEITSTTNYILSNMATGLSFEEALKDAKNKGYVEADEALDLDGLDAAAKLVILANWIMGMKVTMTDIKCIGIRKVTIEDIKKAEKNNSVLKLVASCYNELVVSPKEIPKEDPLGVNGTLNAIAFTSEHSGTQTIIGKGAGGTETASSILRDLLDIRQEIAKK
ncbi:CdvA-like protein [bacterium]|nr:CdvA-like protein [bacterium]